VTLPLLFVQARSRGLLLVGVALVALNAPLAWLGQALGGLAGLAIALAVITLAALTVMLHRLHAAAPTLSALAEVALTVAALAVATFAVPALALDDGPSAAVGLALYIVVLAAWRPRGLRRSWSYLRSLA
jgi:hypothetical protein